MTYKILNENYKIDYNQLLYKNIFDIDCYAPNDEEWGNSMIIDCFENKSSDTNSGVQDLDFNDLIKIELFLYFNEYLL